MKKLSNNLKYIYLFNILFGLQIGIAGVATTFQILFNKVGGESLLTTLNQFDKYSILLGLLIIGIDIAHLSIKKYIIALEVLRNLSFLYLVFILLTGNLTPITLAVAFLTTTIAYRFLFVLWMDFNMRAAKREKFKEVIGNIMFYKKISILFGMGISYFLIKLTYPYNFSYMFGLTGLIGIFIIYVVIKLQDNGYKHEGKRHVKLKEIFELQKEKNCFYMCTGKIVLNLSYGVVILMAMLALREGYTEQAIIVMGVCRFLSSALLSKVIPRFSFTSKENMIIGHLLLGVATFMAFITLNFYIGAILYGVSNAFVNVGYYGFENDFDPERKHVYMTTQSSINFTTGFGIYICARLINSVGLHAATAFCVILSIFSVFFIMKLDELEKVTAEELVTE